MRARHRPVLGRTALAMILSIAALGSPSCRERTADPASAEQVLLDRAIGAIWKGRTPDSVGAMRQRARCVLGADGESTQAPSFMLETLVAGDERYREERTSSYGFVEIFAMNGADAWWSIDGCLVPLEDEEIERRRLQPWLFQVSKLEPLKNPARFELRALGPHVLDDGVRVERLQAVPREDDGLVLTFDFRIEDWLLVGVTLRTPGQDDEEAQSLRLSDYREIDGVRFAHHIHAARGDQRIVTQWIESIEVDPEIPDELFLEPELSRADEIFVKERGMNGLVACLPPTARPRRIPDALDQLREGVTALGHLVTGPLVVRRAASDASSEATPKDRANACIAVWPADAADDAAPVVPPATEVQLTELPASRVLCLTHVGDRAAEDLFALLEAHAREHDLTPTAAGVEIWFSPEGGVRQVQIPVP